MKKQRRKYSAQFKATVALEALKGMNIVSEIVATYEVHLVQVGSGKKLPVRVFEIFNTDQACLFTSSDWCGLGLSQYGRQGILAR